MPEGATPTSRGMQSCRLMGFAWGSGHWRSRGAEFVGWGGSFAHVCTSVQDLWGSAASPMLSEKPSRLGIPMTHLVNWLLEHGIARLEQGIQQVNKHAVHDYAKKILRTKKRARYGTPSSSQPKRRRGG